MDFLYLGLIALFFSVVVGLVLSLDRVRKPS